MSFLSITYDRVLRYYAWLFVHIQRVDVFFVLFGIDVSLCDMQVLHI